MIPQSRDPRRAKVVGCRVVLTAGMRFVPSEHWDFGYDYEVVHSWMIGREINNPYFARFPV